MELNLFPSSLESVRLPVDYGPKRPGRFRVERIILAKGSDSTAGRQRFIADICKLYP
ncbi:MAG: hypothetical protein JRI22_15950, partial [Deltaproteobacteria bacterium]|nr:hypothetical protein [Deltaproteobacteria bacterium]